MRQSGPKVKHTCGCVAAGSRWVQTCPKHQAESDAISARWAAEKRASEELFRRWTESRELR